MQKALPDYLPESTFISVLLHFPYNFAFILSHYYVLTYCSLTYLVCPDGLKHSSIIFDNVHFYANRTFFDISFQGYPLRVLFTVSESICGVMIGFY